MNLSFKEIAQFQLFLKSKGFYTGAIDGDYGRGTNQAVAAFQKSKGLPADGVAGKNTLRAAIADGYKGVDYPQKPISVYPLSPSQRLRIFGKFEYEAGASLTDRDAIRIKGDWEDKNIVLITIPQLVRINGGKVRCHRLISKQMIGLWQAWEDRGLIKHVITWSGCFYPRFVRGVYGQLSNHSWGSAFDINFKQNGLNKEPALVGEVGCVRELVETALEFGFYWGGWFDRQDGMHFEVFKIIK